MFTKGNGKFSVGFNEVWLSQCLCKSELFNLHSANHVQVARIIYLDHGLPQTSLFPWENVPSPSCDSDLESGSQEQAGWIATEEYVPAWLPTFSRVSGSYLCSSTLQRVQSQSRKHEHIRTMRVAASPQEPCE